MYNRYIPSQDGSYRRQIIRGETSPQNTQSEKPVQEPAACNIPPKPAPGSVKLPLQLDTGDLLVLLVLLLILNDGNGNMMSTLIAIAAFLFMQ